MQTKKELNKLFSKKAFISYFQIFVLIIAIFAFSYMIDELFNKEEEEFISEEGNNKSLDNLNEYNSLYQAGSGNYGSQDQSGNQYPDARGGKVHH